MDRIEEGGEEENENLFFNDELLASQMEVKSFVDHYQATRMRRGNEANIDGDINFNSNKWENDNNYLTGTRKIIAENITYAYDLKENVPSIPKVISPFQLMVPGSNQKQHRKRYSLESPERKYAQITTPSIAREVDSHISSLIIKEKKRHRYGHSIESQTHKNGEAVITPRPFSDLDNIKTEGQFLTSRTSSCSDFLKIEPKFFLTRKDMERNKDHLVFLQILSQYTSLPYNKWPLIDNENKNEGGYCKQKGIWETHGLVRCRFKYDHNNRRRNTFPKKNRHNQSSSMSENLDDIETYDDSSFLAHGFDLDIPPRLTFLTITENDKDIELEEGDDEVFSIDLDTIEDWKFNVTIKNRINDNNHSTSATHNMNFTNKIGGSETGHRIETDVEKENLNKIKEISCDEDKAPLELWIKVRIEDSFDQYFAVVKLSQVSSDFQKKFLILMHGEDEETSEAFFEDQKMTNLRSEKKFSCKSNDDLLLIGTKKESPRRLLDLVESYEEDDAKIKNLVQEKKKRNENKEKRHNYNCKIGDPINNKVTNEKEWGVLYESTQDLRNRYTKEDKLRKLQVRLKARNKAPKKFYNSVEHQKMHILLHLRKLSSERQLNLKNEFLSSVGDSLGFSRSKYNSSIENRLKALYRVFPRQQTAFLFFDTLTLSFYPKHNDREHHSKIPTDMALRKEREMIHTRNLAQIQKNGQNNQPANEQDKSKTDESKEAGEITCTVNTKDKPKEILAPSNNLRLLTFEAPTDGKRSFIVCSMHYLLSKYLGIYPFRRHVYEIIRENSPCRIYFDVEFEKEFNPGLDGNILVEIWLKLLCKKLEEYYNISIDRRNFLILDSSNESKFSQHIIGILPNDQLFLNNQELGLFVGKIVTDLAYQRLLNDERCKNNGNISDNIVHDKASDVPKGYHSLEDSEIEFATEFDKLWVFKENTNVQEDVEDTRLVDQNTDKEVNIEVNNQDLSPIHEDQGIKNNTEKKIFLIDTSVYSRNRSFRLLGSCKYKKTRLLGAFESSAVSWSTLINLFWEQQCPSCAKQIDSFISALEYLQNNEETGSASSDNVKNQQCTSSISSHSLIEKSHSFGLLKETISGLGKDKAEGNEKNNHNRKERLKLSFREAILLMLASFVVPFHPCGHSDPLTATSTGGGKNFTNDSSTKYLTISGMKAKSFSLKNEQIRPDADITGLTSSLVDQDKADIRTNPDVTISNPGSPQAHRQQYIKNIIEQGKVGLRIGAGYTGYLHELKNNICKNNTNDTLRGLSHLENFTFNFPSFNLHKLEENKNNFLSISGENSPSPYPNIDQFVYHLIRDHSIQGEIRSWLYKFGSIKIKCNPSENHTDSNEEKSKLDGHEHTSRPCSSLSYVINKYRWCGNIRRHHKSNHIQIVVDLRRGYWYQKCFDPCCRAIDYKSLPTPIPSNILPSEDDIDLMETDLVMKQAIDEGLI